MATIETYYLIDYENVHSDGLAGCGGLTKSDHIIIFFTANARKIDMGEIFDHGEASFEMEKVPTGNQSADMHIVSYLGYLVGNNKKTCKVVIVSKDTDFDNVIDYWKTKTGISVVRTPQIKTVKPQNPTKKTSSTATKATKKATVNGGERAKLNQEVMQAARSAGFDASVANTAAQIAVGFYGNERMLLEVHNALRDKCTDYLDLYESIKPILSKYAGSIVTDKTLSVPAKNKTELNSEIQKLLSQAGYPNDVISYVASTAVKNLGIKNGKQQTYRTIISKYGQNKGLAIYNHIKKHL